MRKTEMVEAFAELMNTYNENRAKWVAKFGNDNGFDAWFTSQVVA